MSRVHVDRIDTSKRLAKLRELMKAHDVQALVCPSEDQHASEYPARADERRAFISGFNGSAGCVVVTSADAYMFTDGRYFLQAEKQLDHNWTLMKQGLPDVPTWQDFLWKNLASSTRVGVDPTLISASDAATLAASLKNKSSELVSLPSNLVDEVWGVDRPARPRNEIIHLDTRFSGESHAEKLLHVREEMEKLGGTALVVTMLDEVAWLLNLRGSDIDYNPVFFAYAVVPQSGSAHLFVDKAQLTTAVLAHLGAYVDVHPYDAFFEYLRTLAARTTAEDGKILIGDRSSLAVAETIGQETYISTRSPIADLKAVKNATEREGFRQCHIRDGAALCRYFAWLERQLVHNVQLTECEAADQLEKYRSELDLFRGLSFDTISSTGPNGAIIHYSPTPDDCAIIKREQIYLCDSGGQYLDGTTDVTRTWHFGTPTTIEKQAFTRVLQGHIALDTTIFPEGTSGYQLDVFARRPLWEVGLDYRHGTGHGIGAFLNVHEGPHGIGTRIAYNAVALKPGMTVSNEPGYYEDGKYGIRIENVLLVREVATPYKFGDKKYLGFEHVTMCPIHKGMIDVSLLSPREKEWVDAYHAEIWRKVSPLLSGDQETLDWLRRETEPLNLT
ncbi:putative Xaa-Pro aminopeptidase P [Fistulina hepatica ATCC 64428]|uniref:Putative Xaa-Pro aminopeptidase P n=1 Tax=Fistulina hepatica ATCC 64428 TaxID=1128425 RepID=A0A0D7ANY1_9AGAR|nr:putative Xaa-Pro aminopeptidase P [Fistulina hepatica ATCC 64428]